LEIRFALDLQKFKDKVNAHAPDTKIKMPDNVKRYPTGEHPVTQSPQQDELTTPLIDLDHLAGQTLYDKELQNEVLGLFHQQLLAARDNISDMDAEKRRDLAHCLVGAARAVGAFTLGRTIEALGRDPTNPGAVSQLITEIELLIPHVAALMTSEEGAGG